MSRKSLTLLADLRQAEIFLGRAKLIYRLRRNLLAILAISWSLCAFVILQSLMIEGGCSWILRAP